MSNTNPAVLEHCRTGGRYLHWLGYKATNFSQIKPELFHHVGTNKSLAVDAWRPKQPNGPTDPQCLKAYMGLEYNKSWYLKNKIIIVTTTTIITITKTTTTTSKSNNSNNNNINNISSINDLILT